METENKIVAVGELYTCIQGEGKYAGIPHILIRMMGCKLRCQFENSICDTWYASWTPEKGKFTLENIRQFYIENPHLRCTMITGGGPTSNPKLLIALCELAKEFGHFITIETEGSEFVRTVADFISLSPKLKSSIPRPGSYSIQIDRHISEHDKEQHEKYRTNYEAMRLLIKNHKDYQLKPVICSEQDLEEVFEIQKILNIPKDKVWLMPEGFTDNILRNNRQWLMKYCVDNGYNYTDRLHIVTFGNKRGV